MEIGTRFSGGDINFVVTERIAAGQYSLTAETAGTVGNEYIGTLFPIDYVPELAAARLADILVPGEDEESDDALRARYEALMEAEGGLRRFMGRHGEKLARAYQTKDRQTFDAAVAVCQAEDAQKKAKAENAAE